MCTNVYKDKFIISYKSKMWKCKYCDQQFPKEGNWETYQKINYPESEMRRLGNIFNDINNTNVIKDTKWFNHLIKIPKSDYMTCKKRRCIDCYIGDGKIFKFNTRSGWQKHQTCHHGSTTFQPKYNDKKERRTKLKLTIDNQVKFYTNEIEEEMRNKHKITNIKVHLTWDSEAPKEPDSNKVNDKRIKLKIIKKNDKILKDQNEILECHGNLDT